MNQKEGQKIKFKIGNRVFRIKDCKGLSSIRGLMFDDMTDKDGALIYANSIWMPFVKHKLILFFMDENFKILKKETAVPITLNPKTWKIYKCDKAKYCLEIRK